MRHLDLFAGIGGFSLACSWHGITTTQFVEKEPYCQRVLAKNFPGVPIHDDITTFYPRTGEFDLITAGFPCQDISCANPNGRGLDGGRSGLFFEALRIIRMVQPTFSIFENVPNLINRGLSDILYALDSTGLDAEWQVVSAASVGAPHQRERLFLIAYPKGIRSPGDSQHQARANQTSICGDSWWRQNPPPKFTVHRMDARLPNELDRVRALGNTVVPQCAEIPIKRILELNNGHKKKS